MKKASSSRYWITLVTCCGLAASSIGIFTNSIGVFYTPVSDDLAVGRGVFALHATLTALSTGFLSPLAAKLLRRVPLRLLLAVGVVLSCGTTALMALADNVMWFYVLGILKGVGITTFSLMPVTAIIGNWFEARHGLAVGVALSFSGLSGAVFSPLFSRLIASVGWQQAYLYMALFGLILALPGVFLLRWSPREVGLPPYGGTLQSASISAADVLPAAGKPLLPALALLSVMTVLHTSVTGIAQHFPGLSETLGMGAQVGAAMVSAGMIGNIVSKLIIGALSDRVGPFRASVCLILVNAGALAALLLMPPALSGLYLAAAFLYGAVYSVGAVGIPLLTRSLFGTENYASVYSLITLFTSVGSASSLTIVGLVYDFTGGYTAALLGGLAFDAVNLVILLVLQRMKAAGRVLGPPAKS